MYISPTRKNSVVPSRIKKSFSPAVYIFHAIFQNPSFLSLLPPMSILLYTLERTARIPRTPQGGNPRSSAPATRIQIRKLSLSFHLVGSIVPFLHERKTKSEKYGQRKEKRSDVCASIYDVRWIGARASTLVTILMRLLYDVTFNGAPRPLPSGHNSPAGPSGFFRCGRQQTEKNRNDREMRAQTRISRGGDDPFNVVSRNCGFQKSARRTIALKH